LLLLAMARIFCHYVFFLVWVSRISSYWSGSGIQQVYVYTFLLTSSNASKYNLQFADSFETAFIGPFLQRLLIFRVTKLMSIFHCLDRSK
jgi:hypothetical protein